MDDLTLQVGLVDRVELDDAQGPDACGGEVQQREDDREDVVRRRLDVYAEQTAPLSEYYAQRGLLRTVQATGTQDEVTDRVLTAVKG